MQVWSLSSSSPSSSPEEEDEVGSESRVSVVVSESVVVATETVEEMLAISAP
jgi:hypothetical protein